jgi:methionyl-tRNA formyltransferase
MIKIAFFGTPELTTTLLDSLKNNDLTSALVVTNPDEPKGRGLVLTPPPAKLWAIENDIPFLQPEKLDDDFFTVLKKMDFDIFIVAAYGKIFPEKFIDMPKHGTLNVHYSLLPKYRGATPVESAILSGDAKTGVSIQQMRFKLDTGPIVASEDFPIPSDITAPALRDALNKIAAAMLPNVIRKYVSGEITPVPQDENFATHSKKIKKEDGLIDPHGNPVLNYRKFRAYISWPRTYFFEKGVRIIISAAQLEDGVFKIEKVIPEGKKEMPFRA